MFDRALPEYGNKPSQTRRDIRGNRDQERPSRPHKSRCGKGLGDSPVFFENGYGKSG